MTWHNLPTATPPTLSAIGKLCPHGWIEIYVEHFSGSGMGSGEPQDPDSFVNLGRTWGLTPDGIELVDAELDRLHDYGDGDSEWFFEQVVTETPHQGTSILRVVPQVPKCKTCGQPPPERVEMLGVCERPDCNGTMEMSVRFETFGADGALIYSTDSDPEYTADQPAPKPGRGDMWQQVIDRWNGKIRPEIIDLFKARSALGIDRYGTPLQAGNGRDVCDELVHETLDRIAYAEQAAAERPDLADIMAGIQEGDIITLAGLLAVYGRLDDLPRSSTEKDPGSAP